MMKHQLSARTRPHGFIVTLFLVAVSAISIYAYLKSLQRTDFVRKDDNADDNDKEDTNQNNDNDHHENCRQSSTHQMPGRHGNGWSDHLPSHIQREQMKEQRRKEKIPMLALKSKLYDNITMLDPQGQILSKISRKKARWYVQKNLAEWKLDDEANTIQLKFEPKARSTDRDYGKRIKKNICVACGDAKKHQMRFYIVPHVYRNLFPKQYKTHMSHDVVLLCSDCHLICGQASNIRMNELEEQFHPQKKYYIDHELYKIQSSAMALMNWREKIPSSQVAYHESNVTLYFKKYGDRKMVHSDYDSFGNSYSNSNTSMESPPPLPPPPSITKEQLQQVIDIDYRIQNSNYIPGPELVVNSLVNNHEAMADFIRGWRQFFLDTIHPRHLPQGWSINHPITCDE